MISEHELVVDNFAGAEYAIADIGMRMLQPPELLRAQFGRFAEGYTLIGTKTQQVQGIGNSVPPELAYRLVACNVGAALETAA